MKKNKILNIVMLTMFLVVLICNFSLASAAPDPSKDYTGAPGTDVTGINNIGNQIITIVSTVGSIASVIVLVILGLKYMMGSAEEKAEYKKTLMPYIIGAALVFAASAIAGIVFSFTTQLSGQ